MHLHFLFELLYLLISDISLVLQDGKSLLKFYKQKKSIDNADKIMAQNFIKLLNVRFLVLVFMIRNFLPLAVDVKFTNV